MVSKKLLMFSVVGLVVITSFYSSQPKYFSWDFADCDIKDILYAVSLDTGISIVADDTVNGTADLKFAGNDFSVAFDAFLKTSRLYVEKDENVWTVSRCSVQSNLADGLFSFDAYDVTPAVLLEKLSLFVDDAITYDSLPSGKMSVHFKDLTETDLLNCLARLFGNYEVVRNENGVHISRKISSITMEESSGYVNIEVSKDGFVTVDLQDALFSEVADKLFAKAGNGRGENRLSFCNLSSSDVRIKRCYFTADSLLGAIETLSSQNGYNLFLKDGIYYLIFNPDSKDDFISGQRNWEKFFLQYVPVDVVFSVIHSRMDKVACSAVNNSNFFFAKVNQEECQIIQNILLEVDVPKTLQIVELKYLKPGEFLEQLPPSINKEHICVSSDNSCVYFDGSKEEYKALCEQLEYFDKPAKRLSYDLLILQYDESNQNMANMNLTADTLSMGERNNLVAQLGSVMSLNLNVVSAFGLTFAAALQSSIEKNTTRVFADTTLYGVSGKPINFQNTNTYRYRDNNLDPDTGKPIFSGVTKEIVSGITLDITGWISGDQMVTSTVTATVSRRGTDLSSTTGNPPPTTEKIVTTEVCCKSGEPVILSGLIQDSVSIDKKFLGGFGKTKEKSQMVIYLVPHVQDEKPDELKVEHSESWAQERIARLKGGNCNE